MLKKILLDDKEFTISQVNKCLNLYYEYKDIRERYRKNLFLTISGFFISVGLAALSLEWDTHWIFEFLSAFGLVIFLASCISLLWLFRYTSRTINTRKQYLLSINDLENFGLSIGHKSDLEKRLNISLDSYQDSYKPIIVDTKSGEEIELPK